jgi:hypothetical protein
VSPGLKGSGGGARKTAKKASKKKASKKKASKKK